MAVQIQHPQPEVVIPEPLVMSATPEGWRVYSTANPKTVYLVTGTQGEPRCTCPQSVSHPGLHCLHVSAALAHLPVGNGNGDDDRYDSGERQAIQEESRTEREPSDSVRPLMTLKRSVSPDGRIDSLSVEFACDVADLTAQEIQTKATRLLGVQSTIVQGFLGGKKPENGNGALRENRNRNGAQAHPANGGSSPAVPARLVDVGGMNGKWGRRLFLNVEVNGRNQKLFGKVEELIAHILAAGYYPPEPFVEGAVLDIPCRVTTKRTPDGKYENVEQVLPTTTQARPRQ